MIKLSIGYLRLSIFFLYCRIVRVQLVYVIPRVVMQTSKACIMQVSDNTGLNQPHPLRRLYGYRHNCGNVLLLKSFCVIL